MDYPMYQLEFFNHRHNKDLGLGDFVDKKSMLVHVSKLEFMYFIVRKNYFYFP